MYEHEHFKEPCPLGTGYASEVKCYSCKHRISWIDKGTRRGMIRFTYCDLAPIHKRDQNKREYDPMDNILRTFRRRREVTVNE